MRASLTPFQHRVLYIVVRLDVWDAKSVKLYMRDERTTIGAITRAMRELERRRLLYSETHYRPTYRGKARVS